MGTTAYDALTALMVELRTEAGLTQEELASRMGRHFTWVSKVERGTRRLDVVELCEMADALGVDPVEVMHRFRKLIAP